MDSSDFLSDADKDSAAYRACLVGAVGGGVASGLMVGRWLGVQGLLAGAGGGAVLGLVVGLKTCPRLAPRIRDKMLSGAAMTDAEVGQSVRAVQATTGVRSTSDALYLLALVRAAAPAARASTQPAMAAHVAAGRLLTLRA